MQGFKIFSFFYGIHSHFLLTGPSSVQLFLLNYFSRILLEGEWVKSHIHVHVLNNVPIATISSFKENGDSIDNTCITFLKELKVSLNQIHIPGSFCLLSNLNVSNWVLKSKWPCKQTVSPNVSFVCEGHERKVNQGSVENVKSKHYQHHDVMKLFHLVS